MLKHDLRKLVAESNDSPSGGGARDFRFPYKKFRPVMHRIFAEEIRKGRVIRIAEVNYLDKDGVLRQTELKYLHAKEGGRRKEDRIPTVHKSPALGGRYPDTGRGRIFLAFSKFDHGMIRCDWAYEDQLRAGNVWAPEINSQILNCMAAAAAHSGKRTVQGYYDFVSGQGFCDAD